MHMEIAIPYPILDLTIDVTYEYIAITMEEVPGPPAVME